jgi:uncharacterized damage-inducible protein DinB
VIADVPAFLRYFKGVHGRTVRDVTSLPPEAEAWRPPASPDEEGSWGAPEIVRHMAEARLFFAGAFVGEGWVWESWPDRLERRASWVPALEASFEGFGSKVGAAPEERLRERVEAIASDGPSLSGWRVLMMMTEHEVHHRSQLETYAGLNGWPVNQIFGRTYEWVTGQLERERNRSQPE